MIPGRLRIEGTGDQTIPVPPDRCTLHWYAQDIIEPHTNWSQSETPVYIFELAKHLKAEFYGGYAEDYISLGQHELSEDAMVLVHQSCFENAENELFPGYKGTLISYSSIKEVKAIMKVYLAMKTSQFDLQVPPNQKKMHSALKAHGIFSYTGDNSIVVPNINTPMVAKLAEKLSS